MNYLFYTAAAAVIAAYLANETGQFISSRIADIAAILQ